MNRVVFANGFIGSGDVPVNSETFDIKTPFMATGVITGPAMSDKVLLYCRTTEELYERYKNTSLDGYGVTDLLSILYKHIGDYPAIWLDNHFDTAINKDNFIGHYNIEFISETLCLALQNKPRSISLTGWNTNFRYGQAHIPNKKSVAYIKAKQALNNMGSVNFQTFMTNWMSSVDTVQGVLLAAKLMFGKSGKNPNSR